jgi:beta-glucosidase
MDLPGAQAELIQAVASANPKTIVVKFSGAPVTMDFLDRVPVVVQAWFPGQECGHSIARILTGMINPSGHLPMSWPKKIEDNPSFGNFPAENDIIRYEEGLDIGYRFYDRKESPVPLFPFGFGLSYTTFEVTNGLASSTEVSPAGPNGEITISCLVKNTGSRQGKVVVQFYVKMPDTMVGRARPIKELKVFKKVELAPGQEENVAVLLDKYAFSIYDAGDSCWKGLKGVQTVHIGMSSEEISTSASFAVPEEFTWTGI